MSTDQMAATLQTPVSTQLKELLLQSLEHENGGVQVYQTALRCVRNSDLREEWQKYLEQTKNHVQILTEVCDALEIDSDETTPGCEVVRHVGRALVEAMEMAADGNDPAAAELVACECVVLAETKDHFDWEMIGECAKAAPTVEEQEILQMATEQVEEEEDEHLYHTKGWCRELWLKSLGIKAVLPPPEESKDVKTAEEAAKVEKSRKR
jgi:ferritin-like metal-binding protein YciE